MKTSRLWLIAGSAALLAAIVGVSAAIATAGAPDDPDPTPTPTGTVAVSPTPTATPTPTPTVTDEFEATCENTVTDEFLALMSAQGWTSKNTVDDTIGPKPFADFLDGVPYGAAVCRWALDPDAPTDNVIDLAWSFVPAEVAADVIQRFPEQGYVRTDGADGIRLVHPDGGAYLFVGSEVRWATTADDLAYIRAPGDDG